MVLVGCGAVDSREAAAAGVAQRFRVAMSEDAGSAACDLLAPVTRRELEHASDLPCQRAVMAEGIPAGRSAALGSDVYGDQARVRFDGDTLFLAQFTGGWLVTAAGCTPRGELPYECTIKGV
jgi:hypothetical protein